MLSMLLASAKLFCLQSPPWRERLAAELQKSTRKYQKVGINILPKWFHLLHSTWPLGCQVVRMLGCWENVVLHLLIFAGHNMPLTHTHNCWQLSQCLLVFSFGIWICLNTASISTQIRHQLTTPLRHPWLHREAPGSPASSISWSKACSSRVICLAEIQMTRCTIVGSINMGYDWGMYRK